MPRAHAMSRGRAIALTALSGALYGAAFPPWRLWPLAWVALVPVLLALRGASVRRAVGLGAVLGLVASWGVGDWMPRAVVRYSEQSYALGVLVFVVCALLQSCWQFAGFALVHRRLARRPTAWTPLALAAAWTTAELARAKPAIGNPWALLGYSQTTMPLLAQTADLCGVFGIGFALMAANAALAMAIADEGAGQGPVRGGLVTAGLVLACVVGYGAWAERRLAAPPPNAPTALPVTAVQGDLDLKMQWRPEFYGANLGTYRDLTVDALAHRRARVVVWPENALTFFLERERGYREFLGAMVAGAGAELLTGGPRVLDDGPGPARFRNAAFVLAPGGVVTATYEKRALVPFAEYFPFPRLDFLRREFGRVREFEPGDQQAPLATAAGPAGLMICNEAFFGDNAADRVRHGATWLVALANDSWVGEDRYAEIALEMTRLRAIEVRRWLVRASTSGPSAVVDPLGRVVARVATNVAGTASGDVVPRTDLTPYARMGDVFAWACAIVTALLVLRAREIAARGA